MTQERQQSRVLVTGASRGIGRAIAVGFAQRGHAVAVLARPSAELDSVADEVRKAGVPVAVAPCDVHDSEAVAAAIAHVDEVLGGIDVLVNNAGGGRYDMFEGLDDSDWESMMSLNVSALARVTRAVLPVMRRQGSGHIINIGSTRGHEGAPRTVAYTASKFAVTGMTRTLRQELDGTGIAVSLVSPGGVKTGFGGIDPADKDPSWMDPATVADLVAQVAAFRGRGIISEVTILPEPLID